MRKLKNKELNRKTTQEYKAAQKSPFAVVLDNVRSLNNIGSFFRTGDAFMTQKIFLCGISATPPDNGIRKTALDAEKSVEWEYYPKTEEAVKALKKSGYIVMAVEQVVDSIMLQNFNPMPDKNYAFVFGNEVKGVQQSVIDICDGCIEIPQEGIKHSVNISISGGIVLWDFYSKIRL
ncbi:MAG: TrmH family RNA methyltransferase [Bacteroidota bacterium]|nr:TrmH family RNA methyltransferase [Bacteroidota bacterium]